LEPFICFFKKTIEFKGPTKKNADFTLCLSRLSLFRRRELSNHFMPIPKAAAFRKDVFAGIIVFLIALPLCLGIAQACDVSPLAGIVSGVIGGVVIGFFSKSQLSVSGPAAGLIAIVVTALATFGSFEIFLCSVIIAGVLQLLLGAARAGGLAHYFPSAVIEGMLAGIGLTIIIKEFPNAVGYLKADAEGLSEGEQGFRWADDLAALQHTEPTAILISVAGLLILALWTTKPFKRWNLVPAGLLVVFLGTVINEIFRANGSVLALENVHLVRLPLPTSLEDFLSNLHRPDFRGFLLPQVWITGAVVAAVASIETLLCIEATEKLDPLKRVTPGNAELKAQGIGNILAGFAGGLPITSVIVRSSANVQAGAQSKRSTIFHGLLLLIAVAAIPALINHIPKATLSAILLFTGYRLCRPAVLRHLYKEGGWSQVVPYLVTIASVVFLDLLRGVGIGLIVAIFFLLRQNMRIPYSYQRSRFAKGDLIKLQLSQQVTFLNKAGIKEILARLPAGTSLILDATGTEYMDFDVLDVIRDFTNTAAKKGIKVSLQGFKEGYKVPESATEHELLTELMEAGAGLPIPTSGLGRKLLRELEEKPQIAPDTNRT
jgi:MFS superfamily sulfate permease-like transporter